jgi:hypothetical protein
VKHNTSVALLALFAAAAAHADTTIGVITDRGWQPMRGSINVGAPVTTEAACWTALRAWAEANRTRIATPKCRNEKVAAGIEYVAPPPPPPPPPLRRHPRQQAAVSRQQ